MSTFKSSAYYNRGALYVVTRRGRLHRLDTPFQVRCREPVNDIALGTLVYVDGVRLHPQHRLMFYVLGQWLPYVHFSIVYVG